MHGRKNHTLLIGRLIYNNHLKRYVFDENTIEPVEFEAIARNHKLKRLKCLVNYTEEAGNNPESPIYKIVRHKLAEHVLGIPIVVLGDSILEYDIRKSTAVNIKNNYMTFGRSYSDITKDETNRIIELFKKKESELGLSAGH